MERKNSSINDILKKLGRAIVEERALTDKIKRTPHHDICYIEDLESDDYEDSGTTYSGTLLKVYFDSGGFIMGKWRTFQDFAFQIDSGVCPKCEALLALVEDRKALRRTIGGLRAAITKRALALVREKEIP